MAGEQTKAFIAQERQNGASDQEISLKLLDQPKFVAGLKKAYHEKGVTNRQFFQGLGLNLPERKAVDLNQVKKDAMLAEGNKAGKTKAWESGLLGFSDLGAGVVQGALYAKDKVTGGDSYKKFTQKRKDIDEFHNARREGNDQGFDGWRLGGQIASTAPMAALGRGYQGAKILSQTGAKTTGLNALVGAGVSGAGFAESSDKRITNTALGAVGGGVGGVAGEKIGQGINRAITATKNTASKFSNTQTNALLSQVNQKLDDILQQNHGMSLSNLSDDVASGLRQEAVKILRSGKNLNPEAVARKVVLDKLGLKGTQAQLTGDPLLWNKQMELSKIHGAGDPLRDKLINDNIQLKSLLDDAVENTRGTATDQYGAMDNALSSIKGQLGQNKDYIRTVYDSARNASGNDVKLGGADFVQEANKVLDDNFASMSLPASVKSILKHFEKNPDEFTLGKSEEIIKRLNQAHQASLKPDGTASSETYAIGLVRDVLNNRQNTTLQSLSNQNNPAAELYQLGRQAHGFNANQIESMPLLKDAVKGVEPDKLFNKHVLSGNVDELDKTIQLLKNVNPQAVNDIKQQVLQFITDKSMMQSGQFSAVGMRKAIDKISLRRLKTLFESDELRHITDIQKASHYLITQPAHSNVNNSNSGAAVFNYFSGLLKMPGARVLLSSVKDIPDSIQVNKALNDAMPAGGKLSPTAQNQTLIDRLVQAGVLTGANTGKQ